MAIAPLMNGPLSEYLKATGKAREQFDAELRSGNPAATSIFAAEMIVKAIADLTVSVENGPLQPPDAK